MASKPTDLNSSHICSISNYAPLKAMDNQNTHRYAIYEKKFSYI